MNFIAGTLQVDGRPHVLTAGGGRLPVAQAAVPARQHRRAGIRPEHFVVGAGRRRAGARSVVVEPTGSETQVALRLGGHECRRVSRSHRRASGRPPAAAAIARQGPSLRRCRRPADQLTLRRSASCPRKSSSCSNCAVPRVRRVAGRANGVAEYQCIPDAGRPDGRRRQAFVAQGVRGAFRKNRASDPRCHEREHGCGLPTSAAPEA